MVKTSRWTCLSRCQHRAPASSGLPPCPHASPKAGRPQQPLPPCCCAERRSPCRPRPPLLSPCRCVGCRWYPSLPPPESGCSRDQRRGQMGFLSRGFRQGSPGCPWQRLQRQARTPQRRPAAGCCPLSPHHGSASMRPAAWRQHCSPWPCPWQRSRPCWPAWHLTRACPHRATALLGLRMPTRCFLCKKCTIRATSDQVCISSVSLLRTWVQQRSAAYLPPCPCPCPLQAAPPCTLRR